MKKKQLISMVVPMYNEEKNAALLHAELKRQFKSMPGYRFEIIFVDDGSHDNTRDELAKISAADKAVQVLELSRNFGKEIATTAGLHAARGDAAIMIDADLQHPVELLPEFVGRWQAGAEVVVGVRKRYKNESLQKRLNSWLFYRILNSVAEVKITPRATDYRLLDRQVLDAFNRFSERNRMTRGLIDWLGFRREYVYFDSPARLHGTAGYGFMKLVRLAINSIIGLSLFPLRLAGWFGIFITMLSGMLGIFILVEDQILNDPLGLKFSGPAILAIVNMFLVGIVLMGLGLTALYIAQIHSEVINRPLYVLRKSGSLATMPTKVAVRKQPAVSKVRAGTKKVVHA